MEKSLENALEVLKEEVLKDIKECKKLEDRRNSNMILFEECIKHGSEFSIESENANISFRVIVDKKNKTAICFDSETNNVAIIEEFVKMQNLESFCEEFGIKKIFARKGEFIEKNGEDQEIRKRIELLDFCLGCNVEDPDLEEAYEYIDSLFLEECGQYDGPAEFQDFLEKLRKKVGLFCVSIVDVRKLVYKM